jgi:hypothetical protein
LIDDYWLYSGTGGCRVYDTDPSALQPFCGDASGVAYADAPAWCFDSFCYVDPNNCNLPTTLTGVFPDSGVLALVFQLLLLYSLTVILSCVLLCSALSCVVYTDLYYSYLTCGGGSTFEDWFGVNGTSASSYNLDDLADVVETYIKSLRSDIEDTYTEYASLTTSCNTSHTGCPCSTCELTEGWGTGVSVDFDNTMVKAHATTPITARSTCLSQTMHTYFAKIAGAEYYDQSKFANLYGGMDDIRYCFMTVQMS